MTEPTTSTGIAGITPDRLRRAPRSASRRVRARLGINGGGLRSSPDTSTSQRIEDFVAILATLPAGRLLDLGAGHAIFSRYALAMGWEVTAQDVRASRYPQGRLGIEWIVGDVLDLVVEPGEYDLILCLGLLYHLDLPGQVSLLKGISHTPLLLDTHTSSAEDPDPSPHAHLLGDLVTVQGYRGRYYEEVAGADATQRQAVATASWGNPVSFWPTRASQVQMLYDAGYGQVLTTERDHSPGRTFQLCLPERPVRTIIEAGSPRGPWHREVGAAVGSFVRGLRPPGAD